MKQYLKIIVSASIVIGFFLTWFSLGWTSYTVTSKEDQVDLKYGWPMKFAVQDQTGWDPPFPWQTHYLTARESPTEFYTIPFFVDVFIFSTMATLFLSGLFYVFPNHRGWVRFLRLRYVLGIPLALFICFLLFIIIQSLFNSRNTRVEIVDQPLSSVLIPTPNSIE